MAPLTGSGTYRSKSPPCTAQLLPHTPEQLLGFGWKHGRAEIQGQGQGQGQGEGPLAFPSQNLPPELDLLGKVTPRSMSILPRLPGPVRLDPDSWEHALAHVPWARSSPP